MNRFIKTTKTDTIFLPLNVRNSKKDHFFFGKFLIKYYFYKTELSFHNLNIIKYYAIFIISIVLSIQDVKYLQIQNINTIQFLQHINNYKNSNNNKNNNNNSNKTNKLPLTIEHLRMYNIHVNNNTKKTT